LLSLQSIKWYHCKSTKGKRSSIITKNTFYCLVGSGSSDVYCECIPKIKNVTGRKKERNDDYWPHSPQQSCSRSHIAPNLLFCICILPLLFQFIRKVILFFRWWFHVCNYTMKNIMYHLRLVQQTDSYLSSFIVLGLGCDTTAFSCSVSAWRKWHLWPYGHTTPARTILQTSVL